MLNDQKPLKEFVNNTEKVEEIVEDKAISEEDLQVLKEMEENS